MNLKEDINANAVEQRSLEKLVCSLEENFAKTLILEIIVAAQCITKRNKQNSDSEKEKQLEERTKTSVVLLNGSQEASGNGSEMELSAEQKPSTDRIEFLESKTVDLQKNIDKTSLCQRFLQHSYGQLKSLEGGCTGKLIWRSDGLKTLFENARVVSGENTQAKLSCRQI